MKTRTIIALFLAITLTALNVTRSPLAASNSSEVIARSTIPMLTDTTQPIKVGPGDLSCGQVFQATDIPGIDEMLSDVIARVGERRESSTMGDIAC
jgi:hypothetical protein